MRDDAGFARACSSEQQHRSVDGLDAFALLRVHVVEKAGHGRNSTINFIRLFDPVFRRLTPEIIRLSRESEGQKNSQKYWNR
jgi:hypothetical protein